jgi:hypothetical protein
MGEQTPVDQSLANQYAAGGSSDPQSFFSQIQATPEFAAQYPDWAAYSSAQTAQGTNAVMDPMRYKAYASGFSKAFTDVGLPVDQSFLHNFFVSGIDPGEFANNIDQYVKQGAAYNWQSGQQADLATTAGIADKTAGGDMRQKLQAAVDQHQTWVKSKYTGFQTAEVAGSLVQKV